MTNDIDEFKMILGMARNEGRMEAENTMLKELNKQQEEEIARLRKQLNTKERQLTEKDRIIAVQTERIKELETMVNSQPAQGEGSTIGAGTEPVVVVNQYYLLDRPKTESYVCTLDNDHRMFAGHLLLHTMPDSTPKRIFDQVNKMTQLEANANGRLADAMERVAERPTYGEYYETGATHDDKRRQVMIEPMEITTTQLALSDHE